MDGVNKLEESILSIPDGIPNTVIDQPSLQIDRLPGRLHSSDVFKHPAQLLEVSHVPVSARISMPPIRRASFEVLAETLLDGVRGVHVPVKRNLLASGIHRVMTGNP
jgi:hypothetical protein